MKRAIVSLVAALLMLLAMPLAGAAFSDADTIREENREAVAYISERKIISGFPDGSFLPKAKLTRAQAAKVICAMLEGAEKADALTKTDTGFVDVPASHWAAKYVAYCVDKGIVSGVGDGKFDPDGYLVSAAFGKMLLVAYNKAKTEDLSGRNWANNTLSAMQAVYMADGAEVPVFPSRKCLSARL